MSVNVYVDGFNFYYRLFKNDHRKHRLPNRYKWLNLLRLSELLVPNVTIHRIGYFTAYIRPNPSDPDQQVRQRAYIEALKTLPCLEVVAGNFLSVKKWGVPVGVSAAKPILFDTYEEKGSDVNLACRLVRDACRQDCTKALVISNDGDLAEAIRIVTREMNVPVLVRSPDVTVNNVLRAVATDARILDTKLLKRCQFPATLTNADGIVISKPARW
ncbi:MAG: NYN domain-containing protein [Thermomicrobiales bacterium]